MSAKKRVVKAGAQTIGHDEVRARNIRRAVESMLALRDKFGPKRGKLTVREMIAMGRRY
jgi:hypothetical protein